MQITHPHQLTDHQALLEASLAAMYPILERFPRTQRMWDILIQDPACCASWDMADYLTVQKLGYNDHGVNHVKIVAANALQIYSILLASGRVPDLVTAGIGDNDDAALVIVTGALLHDIGNQVHRYLHPYIGVILAVPILERLLPQIYPDVEKRVQIQAFILHAIVAHDFNPDPLTFEAALVAIADGTDITKGRGRKAFDLGKVDIHSISALAIDSVTIRPSTDFPVEIYVVMNNSAGIFQIEDTLTKKIIRGPLAKDITVHAVTKMDEDGEDRILQNLYLRQGVFKVS